MRPWWECGVVYQLYPRSFQDSDGDGIGDLAGITGRLDHLTRLGVNAIQLSIFAPGTSDHRTVDPMVGDMISFDRLAAAVHARGMKLILDIDADIAARHGDAGMAELRRFWVDRAVDGFRLPAVGEDAAAPPREHWPDHAPGGDTLKLLTRPRRETRPVDEIVLPRELPPARLPLDRRMIASRWDPVALREAIVAGEAVRPPFGWIGRLIARPDAARIAARHEPAHARMAAMLLLTLRGTPIVRQGEELGLDSAGQHIGAIGGRQHAPMPWDGSAFAGFSLKEPWLPLDADWQARNVRAQAEDRESMLSLHGALLARRRRHSALSIGGLHLLDGGDDVLAYERRHWDDRLLVALNFAPEPRALPAPPGAVLGETMLSTLPRRQRARALGPHEGRIVRLL